MKIRDARPEDVEYISEMRRRNGIREGVLALTSERLSVSQDFFNSLAQDDRAFVAEEDGFPAGFAVLKRDVAPRRRHTALLAIMVGTEHQHKGVGDALMNSLLKAADEELNLRRLELWVLTDNKPAIALYKKHGFTVEATGKRAAVKNGVFVDEYFMSRIRTEAAQ